MQLTQQAQVFRSDNGEEFVYLSDYGNDLLFSPDGQTYFTLSSNGFNGSSEEHRLSFNDRHHGVTGKLERKKDVLLCNGVGYRRVSNEVVDIFVVPAPANRVTEYIFIDEFGVYYYVDRPELNWGYDMFRLFIGDGETMRQVPVIRAIRFRDGGTTHIETNEGALYSPSPFKQNGSPTWKDQKLTRLDASGFDVTHHFSGDANIFGEVTLKKK